MDRNLLLAIVLSGLVLALWSSWQQQEMEHYEAQREIQGATGAPDPIRDAPPTALVDDRDAYPGLPPSEVFTPAPAAGTQSLPRPEGERFVNQQPLYAVEFSTVGAAIESWALHDYR